MLTGRAVSPDRIEGRIDVIELETHVLGASSRLFARDPTSHLVPSESRFTMDPSGTTPASGPSTSTPRA